MQDASKTNVAYIIMSYSTPWCIKRCHIYF